MGLRRGHKHIVSSLCSNSPSLPSKDVGSRMRSSPCRLPGPNRFPSSTTAKETKVFPLVRLSSHAYTHQPRPNSFLLLTSGTCCIGGSADVDGPAAPPEISALLLLLPNIDVIDRPMLSAFAILLLVPPPPPLPLGCGVRRLVISTI